MKTFTVAMAVAMITMQATPAQQYDPWNVARLAEPARKSK